MPASIGVEPVFKTKVAQIYSYATESNDITRLRCIRVNMLSVRFFVKSSFKYSQLLNYTISFNLPIDIIKIVNLFFRFFSNADYVANIAPKLVSK